MHQYLFYIGTFPVRAYGLLFMLGIISSGIAAYYIMKKTGVIGTFTSSTSPFAAAWPALSADAFGMSFSLIGHTTTTT